MSKKLKINLYLRTNFIFKRVFIIRNRWSILKAEILIKELKVSVLINNIILTKILRAQLDNELSLEQFF
jgi:hypothetical protein